MYTVLNTPNWKWHWPGNQRMLGSVVYPGWGGQGVGAPISWNEIIKEKNINVCRWGN